MKPREYWYIVSKTLVQIIWSIFPIAHVKKPQRSPLRLRFLTCTLEKNILRNLHRNFGYGVLVFLPIVVL